MGINCPTSMVVGRVNAVGTWQAVMQIALFTSFLTEKNMSASHLPQSQLQRQFRNKSHLPFDSNLKKKKVDFFITGSCGENNLS